MISQRTHTRIPPMPRRQRGIALVISLVVLLIMTLVGVTAMRGTIMEERMAGGIQDQNRAFQAAEAALRDAERYLQDATLDNFDNSDGLYALNADETPIWHGNNQRAGTGGFITYSQNRPGSGAQAPAIAGLSRQPDYFIEEYPPIPVPGGSLEAGAPLGEIEQYRITARGFGGSDNTVVVLRSTFRR